MILVINVFYVIQYPSTARPAAYKAKSINNMRSILLGIVNYSENHNGAWPDQLHDIEDYIYDDSIDELFVNPFTQDNPGYEYVKPSHDADPSKTVVLYQLREGKRDYNLDVCFGDGSVLSYPESD